MAVNKGGTAESFGPFWFRDCKAFFIYSLAGNECLAVLAVEK